MKDKMSLWRRVLCTRVVPVPQFAYTPDTQQYQLSDRLYRYRYCRFLCAPSERLFSTAGDIADGKRNGLLPEKVEMLLFLRKSLLLLNFDD